jgi:hypothetical protein
MLLLEQNLEKVGSAQRLDRPIASSWLQVQSIGLSLPLPQLQARSTILAELSGLQQQWAELERLHAQVALLARQRQAGERGGRQRQVGAIAQLRPAQTPLELWEADLSGRSTLAQNWGGGLLAADQMDSLANR